MVKKELRIKELGDLFGVPVSALRYWEKEGLLSFGRSADNNYRKADIFTIRCLCDITFYRKLAVPIEELRELMHMDYLSIDSTLVRTQGQLEEKMAEMEATLKSIQVKRRQIHILKKLQEIPEKFVRMRFPAIRNFDLYRRSDLSNLVHFEKSLVVMIPRDNMKDYQYGVFTMEPEAGLVRKRDTESKLYLRVLVRTSYDKIEENNLYACYRYLWERGYEPGLAIGKVLVSSYDNGDGKLYNYYETWIEALEKKKE